MDAGPALLGELDGIGDEVVQDLLQPQGVDEHGVGAIRIPVQRQGQALLLRADGIEVDSALNRGGRFSRAKSSRILPDSTLARSRMSVSNELRYSAAFGSSPLGS